MYIKIDENKHIQLKNMLDSLYTFGLVLSDCKINQKNENIANVILSLIIPGIEILNESIVDFDE